jgi:hypothetical protein
MNEEKRTKGDVEKQMREVEKPNQKDKGRKLKTKDREKSMYIEK